MAAAIRRTRRRLGDGFLRDGFHGPLKAAIGAFIGEAGAGADTAWLRADLEKAIREAPRDPALRDDGYIEDRIADLDNWIAWTLDRQREKEAPAAEPCEPTYPAPLGSVAEARAVLDATMRGIVDQVRAYRAGLAGLQEDEEPPPPPAWAINVDVGLGKTRAFREIVAPELVRDGLSVVLAVPRHRLGDEIVCDFAADGITARVYRGRDADDPDAPGEKMCREHERAAAIFQAMGDVDRARLRNKGASTAASSSTYADTAPESGKARRLARAARAVVPPEAESSSRHPRCWRSTNRSGTPASRGRTHRSCCR